MTTATSQKTKRFVVYYINLTRNPPVNTDLFCCDTEEQAKEIMGRLKPRPERTFAISDREANKKYKRKDDQSEANLDVPTTQSTFNNLGLLG